MAKEKNNEELRRQAIRNLAASRAEISEEIRWVQYQLNPKRLLHRAMNRHKPLAVGIASAVGLAAVQLLVRRKRPDHRIESPLPLRSFSRPKPDARSHLWGVVARAVFPAVVNSIVSPLLKFLNHPDRGNPSNGLGD